jgi:hypothetical protein
MWMSDLSSIDAGVQEHLKVYPYSMHFEIYDVHWLLSPNHLMLEKSTVVRERFAWAWFMALRAFSKSFFDDTMRSSPIEASPMNADTRKAAPVFVLPLVFSDRFRRSQAF